MAERLLALIPALAALVAVVRTSTRRHRLQSRLEAYAKLGDSLRTHAPDAGAALRPLLEDITNQLVVEERRLLHRRLDGVSVFTVAFLTLPMAALAGWMATTEWWWRWPVLIFAALWLAVWLAVGVEKIWTTEPRETS